MSNVIIKTELIKGRKFNSIKFTPKYSDKDHGDVLDNILALLLEGTSPDTKRGHYLSDGSLQIDVKTKAQ